MTIIIKSVPEILGLWYFLSIFFFFFFLVKQFAFSLVSKRASSAQRSVTPRCVTPEGSVPERVSAETEWSLSTWGLAKRPGMSAFSSGRMIGRHYSTCRSGRESGLLTSQHLPFSLWCLFIWPCQLKGHNHTVRGGGGGGIVFGSLRSFLFPVKPEWLSYVENVHALVLLCPFLFW